MKLEFCVLLVEIICWTTGTVLRIDVFLSNKSGMLSDLQKIEQNLLQRFPSKTFNINYQFIEHLSSMSVQISVCRFNNTSFVIILEDEPILSLLAVSLSKFGIKTITIPLKWFHKDLKIISNFPVGITESSMSSLVSYLIPSKTWKEIIIFMDSISDAHSLKPLLAKFSLQQIKSTIISLSNINDTTIKSFLTSSVKRKVRLLMVYSSDPNATISILKSAIISGTLQSNYFWIIINNKLNMKDIINILDSTLNPNIIFLKSSIPRLLDGECPEIVCKNYMIYTQFYLSLKSVMEIVSLMTTSLPKDFRLCLFSINGNQFNEVFQNYSSKYGNWIKYSSQISMFDVFATKSEDVTASTPNLFTYVTDFHLSVTLNSTNQQYFQIYNDVFLNIFYHWNNKTIFICSPPISPGLNYLTNESLIPLHKAKGLITDMMKILSREMKFIPLFYEASDKLWGARKPDSFNFSGCIGDIFNNKCLFGASFFTINSMRSVGVDYSAPFFEESTSAILQYPQRASKIWIAFRPLQWNTWLLMMISIIVTTLFCYFLSFFSPLSAWNLKLSFSIIDEIKIRAHWWNVVGSFLMQGQDFYPYAMSSRTVLAFWWLFTVITFSTYSADVTSYLTVKVSGETLKSLADLAARKDLKLLVPEGSAPLISLQSSNYSVFIELARRAAFVKTIDECFNKINQDYTSNLVCLSDTSALMYVAKRHCSKLYLIPETFESFSLGFPVQMDAPFKPVMDMYISKMVETGQMEKWINKYWSTADVTIDSCDLSMDTAEASSITLEDVAGVYICLLFLVLASFIFLFVEVLWIKLLKK